MLRTKVQISPTIASSENSKLGTFDRAPSRSRNIRGAAAICRRGPLFLGESCLRDQ